jgi:hypothetical protein
MFRDVNTGQGRGRRVSGSGSIHTDQNRAVREWAQAKSYQIAQRGRIKQNIVDAFNENAGR